MDTPRAGAGTAWPPPPPPPPPARSWPGPQAEAPRSRARAPGILRQLLLPVLVAAALGALLGGRVAAEDGRTAARAALAAGHPALAVHLDQQVAASAGVLLALDPGVAAAAEHDAEVARLAWARQLAAQGHVDAAVAVLDLVGEPSLAAQRLAVRTDVLVQAAAAALAAGRPADAITRLDEALRANPPAARAGAIRSQRAAAEVAEGGTLLDAGRAGDAVALLDDASAWVTASSTAGDRPPATLVAALAGAYPQALLAAGEQDASAGDLSDAAATLGRLAGQFRGTPEAAAARRLLGRPQTVVGTLVAPGGSGAPGRVRLSTHFSQQAGGYLTSGPFYYGYSDGNGDFAIPAVPVGGPYVLEYFTGGSWMTLVDPRTDQPANPVTVSPLTPTNLDFVVLPG